jgi:hypothetical protein
VLPTTPGQDTSAPPILGPDKQWTVDSAVHHLTAFASLPQPTTQPLFTPEAGLAKQSLLSTVLFPDAEGDASGVTLEDFASTAAWMSAGVVEDTNAQHRRAMKKWIKWLEQERHFFGNPFLSGLKDHRHRTQLLVLYIMYLYKEGKRSEQIGTELSLLKSNWITALCVTDFFPPLTSDEMTRAKKAGKRSTDEERVHIEARETRKQLPLNESMTAWLRETYWVPHAHKTDLKGEELDDMMMYLAIELGWDSGMRVGNLCKTQNSRKKGQPLVPRPSKALLTKDLQFVVGDRRPREMDPEADYTPTKFVTRYGTEIRQQNIELNRYVEVNFNLLATKTAPVMKITVGQRSARERQLCMDLVHWVLVANMDQDDPLFSRVAVTGKRKEATKKHLASRHVSFGIKASAVHHSFPKKLFNTRSMRQGFRTVRGLTAEEKDSRGGWSETSGVGQAYYDHCGAGGRGATAAVSDGGSSVEGPGGMRHLGDMARRMSAIYTIRMGEYGDSPLDADEEDDESDDSSTNGEGDSVEMPVVKGKTKQHTAADGSGNHRRGSRVRKPTQRKEESLDQSNGQSSGCVKRGRPRGGGRQQV